MEDLNEAPETIEELFNGRPHLGFEQSGTCCLFRLIFRFGKAFSTPLSSRKTTLSLSKQLCYANVVSNPNYGQLD